MPNAREARWRSHSVRPEPGFGGAPPVFFVGRPVGVLRREPDRGGGALAQPLCETGTRFRRSPTGFELDWSEVNMDHGKAAQLIQAGRVEGSHIEAGVLLEVADYIGRLVAAHGEAGGPGEEHGLQTVA